MNIVTNPYRYAIPPDPWKVTDLANVSTWWDFTNADRVQATGNRPDYVFCAAGSDVSLARDNGSSISWDGTWISFTGTTILTSAKHNDPAINFGSGDFGIFMVVKTSDSNPNSRLINKGSNGTGRYAFNMNPGSGEDSRGYLNDGSGGYPMLADGIPLNDGQPHIISMWREGSTVTTMLDYSSWAAATASGSGDIDETLSGRTGYFRDLLIGSGSSSATSLATHYSGQMGEIIFTKGAFQGDDWNKLSGYLQDKWGVEPKLQA